MTPKPMMRTEHVMGTAFDVDVRDPIDVTTIDAFFDLLRRIDATFSTYREDSEISRINRGELAVPDASPVVGDVLRRCRLFELATGGAFDIRAAAGAASAVDPSGLVKGWAADDAARLLLHAGARNFCVNAGGDVITHGSPGASSRWRVGVRHPERPDQIAAVLHGNDMAVATSGHYERDGHIVDPRTGTPARGLASVTVVANSLVVADVYATAAFAMGPDGLDWLAEQQHCPAMVIDLDRHVHWTPAMDAYRR